MYHVTKNNSNAKELIFLLEVWSDTVMKNSDNVPTMSFEAQQDWEVWLKEHHADLKGIWLKIAKKKHTRLRYLMLKL